MLLNGGSTSAIAAAGIATATWKKRQTPTQPSTTVTTLPADHITVRT